MSGGWRDPSRRWSAGFWSLDLRGGELADIAHGDRLVLRGVQAVVRDRDWSTAELVVDAVEETDAALTLRVHSDGLGSSFSGDVAVRADGDRLTVALDLVPAADFDTNRVGLVVLHPPVLAGSPAELGHPDGTLERTGFPRRVSPHQPMRDVARLAWKRPGLAVDLRLTGDVFEMEDQRNWTDASFKTYSRPLALPFPYRVAAGEHVRQSVEIGVRELPDAEPAAPVDRIVLTRAGRMPAIALGAATAPDPAPDSAPVGREVLVELDLRTPAWRAALVRAAFSGLPLDVRVVGEPPFDDLASALAPLDVVRVGVFDPTDHVTHHDAAAALRAALPRTPVIGGVRSHFTELNREHHRIPRDLDGVTFGLTPLFHTTSTAQLVESVAMQRLVAEQAVAIAAGRPVHVGPITLRPRFNDVATAPQPAPTRDDLAEGYGAQFTGADDPRQSAPELATWAIASAAALAVPGVASIAFFEEWGPRGIRSATGAPHPVAGAIDTLAALDGELLHGDSPDGLVWAIGAGDDVLVANLDERDRAVAVALDGRDTEVSVPALSWTHLEEPT